jgi:hypothetical protein
VDIRFVLSNKTKTDMNKNILVTTDFSISSLNLLKYVLENKLGNQKHNIVLVYGYSTSDSITDMLFFSKSKVIDALYNEAFEEGLSVLKNKFNSKIHIIRKDIFTGYNRGAFETFLQSNKIDFAFISGRFVSNKNQKNSFDLRPFIKNSTIDYEEISLYSEAFIPEKGELAELFQSSFATSN